MTRIALIGANGFVGSELYQALTKKKSLHVEKVIRNNYSNWKKQQFDIVINAAMPAARFWAKNNPYEDFVETVQKTADIVYGWKYKKLIQISTISARTELDSVYGRHKAAAEALCNYGDNLIVRLSSMYDDSLKKGALIDILKGNKVYVDGKSRYAFASLEFVCKWIANNLGKKGIREIGAKNSISLKEIVDHLKLSVEFEGRIDIQEVENPMPDFPDARQVFTFMRERKSRKSV